VRSSLCKFVAFPHEWIIAFLLYTYLSPCSVTQGMRPTNWLWLAYEFWVPSTDNRTWIQSVSSNMCYFVSTSHYPFYAFDVQLFCVGRGLTNWLSWACEFRMTMNKRSGIFTGCKFEYLQFVCLLSLINCCIVVSTLLSPCLVTCIRGVSLIDCVWHVNLDDFERTTSHLYSGWVPIFQK